MTTTPPKPEPKPEDPAVIAWRARERLWARVKRHRYPEGGEE